MQCHHNHPAHKPESDKTSSRKQKPAEPKTSSPQRNGRKRNPDKSAKPKSTRKQNGYKSSTDRKSTKPDFSQLPLPDQISPRDTAVLLAHILTTPLNLTPTSLNKSPPGGSSSSSSLLATTDHNSRRAHPSPHSLMVRICKRLVAETRGSNHPYTSPNPGLKSGPSRQSVSTRPRPLPRRAAGLCRLGHSLPSSSSLRKAVSLDSGATRKKVTGRAWIKSGVRCSELDLLIFLFPRSFSSDTLMVLFLGSFFFFGISGAWDFYLSVWIA
jgi:hypothetical protein